MKRVVAVVSFALLLAPIVIGQTAPKVPEPSPDLKKLDYFAGTWHFEGDMKPSPYWSSGKFSSTDHNEWMPGGFYLVSQADFRTPLGREKGLAVWGYRNDDKVYTYHEFDSMGEFLSATGTVQGDTWTWLWDDKVDGKPIKGRYTLKILSPTSYAFKFETASSGGEWSTGMEGKATKQ
jgi:Protein of unknown function (DUF1579)